MRSVPGHQNEIRTFADFNRTNLVLQPERPRAVARGHPERLPGRHRPRLAAGRLERGRETHLAKHVQTVVAGGAVAPERDADPARQHLGNRRDAGAELEVQSGAVRDLGVVCSQHRLLVGVDPDAVRDVEPGRQQADPPEVVDVSGSRLPAHEIDFVPLLGGMRVNECGFAL